MANYSAVKSVQVEVMRINNRLCDIANTPRAPNTAEGQFVKHSVLHQHVFIVTKATKTSKMLAFYKIRFITIVMKLRALFCCVLILSALLYAPLSRPVTAEGENCSLCILEFQTTSATDESEDFVIIGNGTLTSQSLSSVQLQYVNSNGVLDSKINLTGTLLPGQFKVYVSESLKQFNPSASALPFALFSGGGTLQIYKQLTSSSTLYDRVGWGDAVTYEGTPIVPSFSVRNHFLRQLALAPSVTVDTGQNQTDFFLQSEQCVGLRLTEIQPFVTDAIGQSIDAWAEIQLTTEASDITDCVLATTLPTAYKLPSTLFDGSAELVVIAGAADDLGNTQHLQLPNPGGSVALSASSYFGGNATIRMPIQVLSYQDLTKGQSWAEVDEYGMPVWKASYTTTPGDSNIFLSEPITEIVGDENACIGIELNEVYPNPVGNDDGQEWVELHNTTLDILDLRQCIVSVESDSYFFKDDMRIGPGEYRKLESLFTENGDEKKISLRNSDDTVVAWSRALGSQTTLIQSLLYTDAPEGRTFAKFDAGWGWTYTPTPAAPNILNLVPPPKPVTDKAMPAVLKTTAVKSASTKKTSTSTAKSKTTSQAATAKAKLGVADSIGSRADDSAKTLAPNPSSSYLFVGFGALALLYAGYEYRSDITSNYRKWRRNRAARRSSRE